MFTEDARTALLDDLIDLSRADPDVTAAALVGSMARGETDEWSDIDLALRLRPGLDPVEAAQHWEERMRRLRTIAGTLDVWAGETLYRVFLLHDSLQVDLSFWPDERFRGTGEPFRVLFGDAAPEDTPAAPDPSVMVAWGWLFALHARSAIARGKHWQALQMINDLRGQLIALACLRHGLPAHQGRGVDRLPPADQAVLLAAVPLGLAGPELARSFRAAVDRLETEARMIDGALTDQLAAALDTLRISATPPQPAD